jgi:hypothetical protein
VAGESAALDEGCRDGIAEGNRRGPCQGYPPPPADVANEHTMSFILASKAKATHADTTKVASLPGLSKAVASPPTISTTRPRTPLVDGRPDEVHATPWPLPPLL